MAREDQATPDAGDGANAKKKMFIMIGAAVGVAIILGIVFMMMGKGDKKAEKKEGAEATAETKAAGGGAHGAPAGKTEGGGAASVGVANIYGLEPFIVNIYDGQELRYLKVKVELEMVSVAVKPELDARLAAIRDAILVLLSTKTLHDIQDIQGKNQMKDEIMSSINKIIPPGKIAKIYFTDFVVQ